MLFVSSAIALVGYWKFQDEIEDLYQKVVSSVAAAISLFVATTSLSGKIIQYAIQLRNIFLENAPEKAFGKSVTGKIDIFDKKEEAGAMLHVRQRVKAIIRFLKENRIKKNGRHYLTRVVISFDDLDRCAPSTVAGVRMK